MRYIIDVVNCQGEDSCHGANIEAMILYRTRDGTLIPSQVYLVVDYRHLRYSDTRRYALISSGRDIAP